MSSVVHGSVCRVVAQVNLAGPQPAAIRAYPASRSVTSRPYVVMRLAGLLIYAEDAEALDDLQAAVQHAVALGARVFMGEQHHEATARHLRQEVIIDCTRGRRSTATAS